MKTCSGTGVLNLILAVLVLLCCCSSVSSNRFELMEYEAQLFDGSQFCQVLQKLKSEIFSVERDWNLGVNEYDLNRFVPFGLGKEIEVSDWRSGNVGLTIDRVKCEQEAGNGDKNNVTKVFACFTAFQKSIGPSGLASRSGISNTMMAAEGSYDPYRGQIHMVGCVGSADYSLEQCVSRISLYFPRSFSLEQRSLVLGSISSLDGEVDYGQSPLLFQLILPPKKFGVNQKGYWSYLSYTYSKATLANAMRKRNQPPNIREMLKHWLLTYPKLQSNGDLLNGLSSLSKILSVAPYAYSNSGPFLEDMIRVSLEVLSLGPFLGTSQYIPVEAEGTVTNPQLLNVSLHLMFTDPEDRFSELSYQNISVLFLEGLYDVLVGQMYLTGCRKINPDRDYDATKRGLDCLIEVKICYPSENTRWLISPTMKISISSKRREDDPLYFTPISLQTLRIQYKNHREDVMFRKTFEGILRIVILFVSCLCVLSQVLHIKETKEATLYMSFFMLLFQAQEIVSCFTDANTEFILQPNESASYAKDPWNLNECESVVRFTNYICKFLGLIQLLLLLWVFGQAQSSKASSSANSMPYVKEMPVLLTSLAFHFTLIPNLIFMVCFILRIDQIPINADFYTSVSGNTFLLRQVVANFLWRNFANVPPLSRGYYLGLSFVRILALLYDCVRDSVTNPYFETVELELMNLANHSGTQVGNIVTVVIMIILAITVHFQQRRFKLKLKGE